MTAFDLQWEAAELKHTVLSLKAVAEAFSRRFTEPVGESRLLAVQTAPEEYEYLFRAVFSLICEARDQAIKVEAAAEELLDQENLREGRKGELSGNFSGTPEAVKGEEPGTPGELKEDFSRVIETKGRKGREK